MTRDEIKTLTTLIGNVGGKALVDDDTIDIFINEVFFSLAMRPNPQMVEAVIKALTSGTSTYSFESDMLRIVSAIMHDELLSPVTEADLDAYSASWQSDSDTPTQFTQDNITARQYRLYPEPDTTSDPLIPSHGEPWGEDFPDNSLVLIYADDREDNIADIYSLPIAFDTLSREFSYPSNHTSSSFSLTCRGIADLFYKLLGVR